MHYGTIKKNDIADGTGVRVSLFVSGCTNHCEGCFQPETWDFNYGNEYTEETQEEIIKELKPAHIEGLTILGGEPFEIENQKAILPLLKRIHEELPNKNVWMYTGFTLETDLAPGGKRYCDVTDEILKHIDVLVDGKFDITQRDVSLAFRGSRNQRIIDIKRTLSEGRAILLDYGKTDL